MTPSGGETAARPTPPRAETSTGWSRTMYPTMPSTATSTARTTCS
jgi:hypothetical protein